jgi:hypothetical protein
MHDTSKYLSEFETKIKNIFGGDRLSEAQMGCFGQIN